MGIFRGGPWKKGVRAVATIERVHMTRFSQSDQGSDAIVFLTFQFSDESGAQVTQTRRFDIVGTRESTR